MYIYIYFPSYFSSLANSLSSTRTCFIYIYLRLLEFWQTKESTLRGIKAASKRIEGSKFERWVRGGSVTLGTALRKRDGGERRGWVEAGREQQVARTSAGGS